ncbi:MAG: alpha/beta fold hydrolase [Acidobacteriota bacterium]
MAEDSKASRPEASRVGSAGVVASAADLVGGAVGAGLKFSALPAQAVKWLPREGPMAWPKTAVRESAQFPRAVGRALDRFASDIERLGGGGDITVEQRLDRPGVHPFRNKLRDTAVIFVHGFGQNSANTWGKLLYIVGQEERLADWDIFSVGYATNMMLDFAGLWSASPPIDKLARFFHTVTSSEPLLRYKNLAIVAHSMGGLVTQRALLDFPELRARVGQYICFGTPSAGLKKAVPLVKLKRQIRDMAKGSAFITDLRKRWDREIGDKPSFELRFVAGDQDEFVPSWSSLEPFPERFRYVVPGNHLTIVCPEERTHTSAQLLFEHLTGGDTDSPLNSARVAVEGRKFKAAIEQLMPNRDKLDKRALVTLALALDSDDQREEAIRVIEESPNKTTDLLGTLAGRLKRRWLFEFRLLEDAERAKQLYLQAFEQAEAAADSSQMFYHAINVAFMALALDDDPKQASDYAQRALDACAKAPANVWNLATQGEAYLYLGNDEAALAGYRGALAKNPEPWQITSMFQQAVQAADELLDNEPLANRLRQLFRDHRDANRAAI